MTIEDYLSMQPDERQQVLSAIHTIITDCDRTVTSQIGSIMAKEMISYTAAGVFKYGLASVKKHMSLHVMPIYCVPELHARYKSLLTKAQFQKGCINFRTSDEVPLDIITQLINDCAKVDVLSILEGLKKQRVKS